MKPLLLLLITLPAFAQVTPIELRSRPADDHRSAVCKSSKCAEPQAQAILGFQSDADKHKHHEPPPPPPPPPTNVNIPLGAQQWSFTAYEGEITKLANTPAGALTFNFPVAATFVPGGNNRTVNYLETIYSSSIASYSNMSMTLQLTASPGTVFNYETE